MTEPPVFDRCPNCGASLPRGTTYCATCGQGYHGARQPAPTSGARTLWLILLIFLGIPALCGGGCLLLVGGSGPGGGGAALAGVIGVLVFALILWRFQSTNKSQ